MNALTRNRPMPGGAIAKLHSVVASNSLVWRSFMIARTSSAACSGVSGWLVCARISPSTFMAGAKPDVMNRSEPLRSTMRRSRSCMSLIPCSRSMLPPASPATRRRLEILLVLRLVARFFLGDDALLQQLLQTLIERLHAGRLAGLDRGIHLRDLALADQVADRGSADHDLVRRDASASDALEQRLRDHGAQRLGQHRAHHLLLGGREHVDHAVDRLRRRARVQRAEHQVAGLRAGERETDCLQIA